MRYLFLLLLASFLSSCAYLGYSGVTPDSETTIGGGAITSQSISSPK